MSIILEPQFGRWGPKGGTCDLEIRTHLDVLNNAPIHIVLSSYV